MSDSNTTRKNPLPMAPEHVHPNGRRCCGRPIAEKCTPEEEAAKTNSATGEKSCCKGHHTH